MDPILRMSTSCRWLGCPLFRLATPVLVKVKPCLQIEILDAQSLQIVAAFAYERFGDNVMMVKEVMTEPLAKARLEEMIEEV